MNGREAEFFSICISITSVYAYDTSAGERKFQVELSRRAANAAEFNARLKLLSLNQ
jgi:hypothetical protein